MSIDIRKITRLKAGARADINVLLVYPHFPVTYWGFQHSLQIVGKKATLPPLGLLTLAALLPQNWKIKLADLNVEELDDADIRQADVVLTGGMLIQEASMHQIIARAHAWQVPVVVGGPAPTTSPVLFADAEIVFRGEAEGRIDELIAAIGQSAEGHNILNAPDDFPDMKNVVVPRFDLVDLTVYASMCIQYSRGCPFQCEFCDIVEIFGRSPRVKSSQQIVAELDAIYALGFRGTLFFVDDNFIGNKASVRLLLPVLTKWQQIHGRPFEFYTEASVDLASDPILLAAMVAAGFTSVFVGIETPSARALEQTKKFQNLRMDLSTAIHVITRAGLEVMGGFIVGFDTDDVDTFAEQRAFLTDQPIPLAMLGVLIALPGTALWRRLHLEDRLRSRPNGDPFSRPNFVPVMDEMALLKGYHDLIKWLYLPDVYYSRCRAFLSHVGKLPKGRSATSGEAGVLLRAMWLIGVLSPNRRHFWALLGRAMLSGRGRMRQAVAHAVQGEHLIRYTTEHVLPRLQCAMGDVKAENAAMAACVRSDTGVEKRDPVTAPAFDMVHSFISVLT